MPMILENVSLNVDRHKLSQVIRNLISNAIKFTPLGGKVTVGAKYLPKHARTDGGSRGVVRVEVRDTGIGIEEVRLSGSYLALLH
jgi:signal transduction histidine kinase